MGAITGGFAKLNVIRKAGQAVSRAAGSMWNLGWGARGFAAEGAVAKLLGRPLEINGTLLSRIPGWRVIDDFVEGTARSIKSIDLTGSTYQDIGKLTKLLGQYAQKLKTYPGGALGGVTVRAREIEKRVLTLVFEPGAATASQEKALVKFVKEAEAAFGINVELVPVQ